MKIKFLLSIFILLSSKILNAQWSTNDLSISQNFGTTASTFAFNANNLFSLSSVGSQGFLPIPTSGIARVSYGSTATNNSIILNGDNSIKMTQGTTTGGGYGKYSVYDLPNVSAVLQQTFNINFNTTSTSGDFNLAIGNYNVVNTGLYSGTSSIFRSSPEIFTTIKWRMSTGTAISFEYRVGSNASTITTYQVINATRFVKGNNYKVDVFANNSGSWQTYTKAGSTYTLPNNSFAIWVDDIQLGSHYPRSIEVSGTSALSSGTSIAMPNGAAINSFVFTASEKSTVANSSITIKDVVSTYKMSTAPFQILQNFKDNPAAAILPDFSYAGYRHGEQRIPDVNATVFDVTNYGAIPNDLISDRTAIIAAVNAATTNGSGIVFFPPGRFRINEDNDIHEPININANNIVFRGSGSGVGGTELFMKNALAPTDPTQLWSTPFMLNFWYGI